MITDNGIYEHGYEYGLPLCCVKDMMNLDIALLIIYFTKILVKKQDVQSKYY